MSDQSVCISCKCAETNNGSLFCWDCQSILTDDDEIVVDDRSRCPKCRGTEYILDNDDWCEGDHEVTCGSCGYKYPITVCVSISISSPAMLPEEEREEDEQTSN